MSTYNDNISTTLAGGTERATLRKPVAMGVIGDPVDDGLLLLGRDALIRMTNALEDVVNVLGNPEDTRSRLGDWPAVSTHQD